ncbi:MAG: hypothetical protein ACOZNI_26080 [Myxococcota bacterium]
MAAAFARGRMAIVRPACLASLGAVAIVYGRFAATALHVERVFGPLTGAQIVQMLGASLTALPLVALFPALRLRAGWTAIAAALLLPAAGGAWPYERHAGPDAVAVAGEVWAGGEAPAGARVTRLGDAVLVDVRVTDLPLRMARPGDDGPRDGKPPAEAVFSREEVLPGFRVPVARAETARFESAMASAAGVVRLHRGWSPGPEPTPGELDAAVLAGVRHLVAGMDADGRFTYVVKGPSGAAGRGYNYPRHAGTAWFLARAAAATGDPVAGEAADRALAYLQSVSRTTEDGRAYVLDPTRDDGKAWVGTTALAALAAILREHPMAAAWTAQVAASVDGDGKVRGEMSQATGAFPEQPANPYGQGQAMLALAAAEREGSPQPALDRAIAFLDGEYMGTAHPVATGDEHWTCLAAYAVREARGGDAGAGICAAYVASTAYEAPPAGAGLPPSVGGAAGGAEAVAARARRTGEARLVEATLDFARWFLAAQYREADVPRIGRNLVGGFRSGARDLDVQIDTVQHVGCALLGAEALVSGRDRRGSWP